MDNDRYFDINLKKFNHDALAPRVREDGKTSDIFAAEDVFIAPSETVAVSTGLGFIFPNDVGLMFFSPSELITKASLRFMNYVFVLENSYYHQDEVKIYLQNTYPHNKDFKKVPEYKLIDGTIISDTNNLFVEGTVKICKGDLIAWMKPVDAAYKSKGEIPKAPIKEKS